MATAQLSLVIRRFRGLLRPATVGPASDRDLLDSYAAGDESAFAELVQRHVDRSKMFRGLPLCCLRTNSGLAPLAFRVSLRLWLWTRNAYGFPQRILVVLAP